MNCEEFHEKYLGFQGIALENLDHICDEQTGEFDQQDMITMVNNGYIIVPGPFCIQIYQRKTGLREGEV